jgi:hypothetical protein
MKKTSPIKPNTSKQRYETAKQIEVFMSDLPSSFLHKYATTKSLIAELRRLQDKAHLYGRCLKARFGGGGGNPLLRAWKSKEICDFEYKWIDRDISFLQALFILIQNGWDYIEPELKQSIIDYPNSETKLFFEVLKEEFDGEFLQKVNGFKLTAKQIEADAKLVENICNGHRADLTEEELKQRKEQNKKKGDTLLPNTWIVTILNICWKYANHDPVLKGKLEDLDRIYAELAGMVVVTSRKERSDDPPKIIRSVKWKNGLLYEGVKGGFRPVTNLYQTISQ